MRPGICSHDPAVTRATQGFAPTYKAFKNKKKTRKKDLKRKQVVENRFDEKAAELENAAANGKAP
ncbi:hypothetical protein ACEQG5_006181 [Pseudomonas aeruginosa]